jgi:hypothetical protein
MHEKSYSKKKEINGGQLTNKRRGTSGQVAGKRGNMYLMNSRDGK